MSWSRRIADKRTLRCRARPEEPRSRPARARRARSRPAAAPTTRATSARRSTPSPTAVAKKDYQRICDDLLAPDLVEEVRKAWARARSRCETGLEDRRNPRIVVQSVKLDGDSAEARVRSTADGEQPSEDIVQLVKVDEGWRIASLAS